MSLRSCGGHFRWRAAVPDATRSDLLQRSRSLYLLPRPTFASLPARLRPRRLSETTEPPGLHERRASVSSAHTARAADPKHQKEESMTEERRFERWKITDLKQNPRQTRMFQPLTEAELTRLMEDLGANGQRTPIEILPDGTILDGHQRLRAAQRLGWQEVDVEIRDDLANDRRAAERRFIAANRHRRQLPLIDQIRCDLRLEQLHDGPSSGGALHDQRSLIERIAEERGLSKRNVQRYENVVRRTPMVVQRAVAEGRLKLVDADTFSRCSEEVKQQVERDATNGADLVAAVKAAIAKDDSGPTLCVIYRRLMAMLEQVVEPLDGHEAEVECSRNGPIRDAELLTKARGVLAGLLAKKQSQEKAYRAWLQGFAKEMQQNAARARRTGQGGGLDPERGRAERPVPESQPQRVRAKRPDQIVREMDARLQPPKAPKRR